ncbi:MAG: carbohydrate binding domain-containing protein [Phycisphaeraceae bacterium]|nr:carbohydrate binding domain-containing protein [Phycisphaeraceae bacterium]
MQKQTHWRQKLGAGLLALTLGFAVSSVNAQNLITDGDAESGNVKSWLRVTSVSDDAHEGKHSFQVNGFANVQNKQIIAIDPEKTYTLSGWFKSAGEKPSKIYFGFAPLDDKKRTIYPWQINAIKGTQTTLVEACTKTDTVLKVADASKWIAHRNCAAAFDVAADFSDLPNRKISNLGITAVENKGDHWEITFSKPCKQAKEAGTAIRLHRTSGTYIYAGAVNKIVPGQCTQYTAKIKGHSIKGTTIKQFWAGTQYVRILILANYAMKKEGVLLIDNLQLTAE